MVLNDAHDLFGKLFFKENTAIIQDAIYVMTKIFFEIPRLRQNTDYEFMSITPEVEF